MDATERYKALRKHELGEHYQNSSHLRQGLDLIFAGATLNQINAVFFITQDLEIYARA